MITIHLRAYSESLITIDYDMIWLWLQYNMAVIFNHIIIQQIFHFDVHFSFHGSSRGLCRLHPLSLPSISRSNNRIKFSSPFWSQCLRVHGYTQAPKIFSTFPHPYHVEWAIPERPAKPTVIETQWSGQEATNSASLWFQRWPVGKISYQEYDKDSPYETFNTAWERVFQHSEDEKKLLVTRGKYGLDLAHAYAAHFSKVPGIGENNVGLVVLCIEALIELIEDRV